MPAEATGLTQKEAAARLAGDGANELPQPDRRGPWRIAREVATEPMFALLLAAGAIYLVIGEAREAAILMVFATASVSIALVQELRTERTLEALRDLTSPRALVIRDGERRRIPGRDVVAGDLMLLAEGDRVPADAALVSATELAADESLLTGESLPVRKRADTTPEIAAPPPRPGGDDLPFVFAGSLIVKGQAVARVTATGPRSEIGRIGKALGGIETETPLLKRQTGRIVRVAGIAGALVSLGAMLLAGLLRGDWAAALLGGITVGMSMMPEEFPLVLTVFMAMGAWRLSRHGVLTRRAAAIETLGAASVLCTDKTGTLTQNRMTIGELRSGPELWRAGEPAPSSPAMRLLLANTVLASAVDPFDPMEQAVHALAADHAATAAAGWRLARHYPLSPELLAVTQLWKTEAADTHRVATKGAPEAIIALCGLEGPPLQAAREAIASMAAEGLRVLAVARAGWDASQPHPDSPHGFGPFEFLGLVGFTDPLRPGVPAAVGDCRTAGIRVVMITGDHPATALAIARQAGIVVTERAAAPPGLILTGEDLGQLDDVELARRVRDTVVFARVMPEQKLRIVEALKRNGEIVAMTGDGVNDAPSLKAAHIGIAMGGRGTDVAREAASLVLLDDDFASMVRAVRMGRRIHDNLRKAMSYIVAIHVPIAGLALLPLAAGLPLILLPAQIAFLEMVIDPVCALVFEAEGDEADVMKRPPRPAAAPPLTRRLVLWSLAQGAIIFGLVAALQFVALRRGMPADEARSLAFAALVAGNIGLVLTDRSFSAALRPALLGGNRMAWLVLGGTSAVLAAVLTIPVLRDLFHLGPLHGDDLLVVLAGGAAMLMVFQLLKRLPRMQRN